MVAIDKINHLKNPNQKERTTDFGESELGGISLQKLKLV
jgi:hypothetical protein